MVGEFFNTCQIRKRASCDFECGKCLQYYAMWATHMFIMGHKKQAVDRFVKLMLMEPTMKSRPLHMKKALYSLYSGLAKCAEYDPNWGLGDPRDWWRKAEELRQVKATPQELAEREKIGEAKRKWAEQYQKKWRRSIPRRTSPSGNAQLRLNRSVLVPSLAMIS